MYINPYNQVIDNMQRSEPLIARYHDGGGLDVIKAEIEGKIEQTALHILVYGAYNAGKSTLINVLLREERAPVGEIPTTDHVDCYGWSGYRLLDTPGVNAPIEHERLAEDQLARTNAVVMVVREGDQDVNDVYVRLFSMMKSDKAVFVILNHQLGSAEEVAVASKRIANILSQLAPQHGVTDAEVRALPIHPVNLKTALTGSIRRHDKLLEYSGFTWFEEAFVDWTRQHDNRCHHLSEVKDTVNSLWYDPAIAGLGKLVEADGTSETEQLRDMERTLVAHKNRMLGSGNRVAAHEVGEIRSDIAQLMRDSQSKEEADEELRKLLPTVVRNIDRWLDEELDGVNAHIKVTVETPQMSESEGSRGEDTNSGVRDKILEGVGKVVTNKEWVTKILVAGRRTKAWGIRDRLGLKGRWTSTLGKWAGGFTRVARGGLAFLHVATAVWDAKQAHNRQVITNKEMKRHAEELHQAIESICTELRRDLVAEIDSVIEHTLGAAIVEVRQKIEGRAAAASEMDRHYQELLDYRNQLEAVVFTSTRTSAQS